MYLRGLLAGIFRKRLAALVIVTSASLAVLGCLSINTELEAQFPLNKSLVPIRHENLKNGSVFDLRGAEFQIVNSRNSDPTPSRDCDVGEIPVNRYPLAFVKSKDVEVSGGLFRGQVPLLSDWRATYCNSAAVRFEDSPNATITGMRVRKSWDAVRFSGKSAGFLLAESWISATRDDCVENDYLLAGAIRDTLFDGCFSGISIQDPDGERRPKKGKVLKLRDVLLRMQSMPYKGEIRHALPIKTNGVGPKIDVKNSVFAIESLPMIGDHHMKAMWRLIGDCKNNKLLVLGSRIKRSELRGLPDCFKLIQGSAAREEWQQVRQNWIDCHADIERFSNDPVSRPANCKR